MKTVLDVSKWVAAGFAGMMMVSCGGGGEEEVSTDTTLQHLEERGFAFSVGEYLRASREGDLEAVTLFHKAGMATDSVAPDGTTALYMAAENGQDEVLETLIEQGAHVNVEVPGGMTPLLAAATRGHSNASKILLDAGAEADVRDGQNWTPLTRAAFEGFSETVDVLAPKSRSELDPALHLASVNGDTRTIDVLLNAGASVYARSNENKTALMYAAANGNLDAVKVLVQNGSNRFAIDESGKTSAQLAEVDGHVDVADYLLEPPTDEERLMPENLAFADQGPAKEEFTPGDAAEYDGGDPNKNAGPRSGEGSAPVIANHSPIPQRIDGSKISPTAPIPITTPTNGGGVFDEEGEEGAFGEGDMTEPETGVQIGAASDAPVSEMPREKVAAVAKKMKMHDYRESQLPVMLDDVVGETATVRLLYGQGDAVEVKAGQQIAETGLQVVDVRRRFITSKQGKGAAVNVSEMVIQDVKSGERTLVVKDVPAKANDTFALMSIEGGDELYDVRRDDQFAAEVPEFGKVRFRVADVRPTQVVLEDTLSGESFTIPRTTYGL